MSVRSEEVSCLPHVAPQGSVRTSDSTNSAAPTRHSAPKEVQDDRHAQGDHGVSKGQAGRLDKGTGEILNTVVDTVSGTLVTTIKGTGAVGTALASTISDVLHGAITGTAQVGGDL